MTSLLLLIAPLLLPQPQLSQDDGGALSADARGALVERLADLVEARYCLPDDAAQIASHLRGQLEAGAFEHCASRAALAHELTGALRAVNGDRHFRVRVRPDGQIEEDEVDPIGAWMRRSEELRVSNCGFARAEVLDGNVGLLDLRAFAPIDAARDTAVCALGLLSGVDALVVDVRANGGGDPATVQLVCSYFFGERTHLNSLVYRLPEGGERVDEFWTLDEVPGARLVDVPLFVVTSGFTGSAAEEFTYNLKSRERALIVMAPAEMKFRDRGRTGFLLVRSCRWKKNSVMMYGANFSPPCPMFAMATSLRTQSANASTALPNPFGALSDARCRSSERAADHIVRKTNNAASAMKMTCLVGVRFIVMGPRWMSGRNLPHSKCHGPSSSP